MRTFVLIALAAFCLINAGCDVILQPPQQGNWSGSNFDNQKYKVTHDPAPEENAPEK